MPEVLILRRRFHPAQFPHNSPHPAQLPQMKPGSEIGVLNGINKLAQKHGVIDPRYSRARMSGTVSIKGVDPMVSDTGESDFDAEARRRGAEWGYRNWGGRRVPCHGGIPRWNGLGNPREQTDATTRKKNAPRNGGMAA